MSFIRLVILVGLVASPALAFAQDGVEDAEASAEEDVPAKEVEVEVEGEPETTAQIAEPSGPVAKLSSSPFPASGAPRLMKENEGRARTNRIGGLVLGGWSIGNFTWATIGLLGEPDDRERAFHLTNAAVNLVVAGVAIGTYFSNVPDEAWEEFGVVETLNEAHGTEKLYLLATGLDAAYFMTGAFLTAKGNVDRKEGMIGTGRSLMFQGAFLFAFDAAMFTFHMLRRSKFVRDLAGGATP